MGRQRKRDKIREIVSAYIDGELPPDDAQYVGRRIQEDPAYARAYSAYRGIRMDMRALPHPDVPAALSASIRAQAAVMQPRRPTLTLRQRLVRVTAAVATLAATMVAFLTGGFGLQNHFAHVTTGGGGGGTSIVTVSTGRTTVTILNPSIRYDESAQIRFTRPMDEQTALNKVIFSPGVAPNLLQYDKQQSILSTKPKSLQPNTRYTVQVPTGLKDAEGNDVSPAVFSFVVGDASNLVTAPSTEPAMAIVPTATALVIADAPTPNATPGTAVAPVATVPDTVVQATEPPAVAQPTTPPQQPAPRPTNTPVPQRPAGTTIAVAQPTATNTPAPQPTATTAPTATVVPATATPTLAPTATTPAIPVADQFKGAYAATANRLGAPLGGAAATSSSLIYFQNGFMLYVSGQPIYVFYTSDRTYGSYPNPGNTGTGSEGGPGPSASLFKPPRAFGVLWTQQNLQGRLGYATQASESGGSGMIQRFEGGTILSVGSDVYVLMKSGSWQPFSG